VKESLQRECPNFIGGEIIAKVAGARLGGSGGKAGEFTVVRRRKVFRQGGFKVVFLWISRSSWRDWRDWSKLNSNNDGLHISSACFKWSAFHCPGH
jgi:hypothetical protein